MINRSDDASRSRREVKVLLALGEWKAGMRLSVDKIPRPEPYGSHTWNLGRIFVVPFVAVIRPIHKRNGKCITQLNILHYKW